MRSFTNWKYQDIEKKFSITRKLQHILLDKWLSVSYPIQKNHQTLLEKLQQRLIENVEDWNEEELKMKFIAPLLDLY